MIPNLGLNSASINYEVALDLLGDWKQPFIRAINEERAKPEPSAALIAYCEARRRALSLMQDDLQPADLATIMAILDRDDPRTHLFR